MSGGLARTGDTMIAFVLGVIFSAIRLTSKFNVSNSISTNTGLRLFCINGAIVVGKPTGDTITSSLSCHLKYFFNAPIITRLAELPELTMCDCFTLYFFENLI